MKQLVEKELSVLTVGTEILAKDLMDQYLRSLGPVSTYYASRLELALETFQKQKIDIIFCELNFSNGSINQFLQKIGGLHYGSDIFCVVAARDNSPELESLRFELSIDEILVKPFNAETIRATVERALKKLHGPKAVWAVELKVALEAERSKRFVEAESFFQRALQRHPEVLEVSLEVARYWLDRGRYGECETLLEKISVKHPNDVRVLDFFGRLLKRQDKHRRAMELLEKAQGLSPLNSIRAMELADNYMLQAVDLARTALRLDEHDSSAHMLIMRVLAARHQYAAALTVAELKQGYVASEHAKEFSAYVQLVKNLGKLK